VDSVARLCSQEAAGAARRIADHLAGPRLHYLQNRLDERARGEVVTFGLLVVTLRLSDVTERSRKVIGPRNFGVS
jgi:hypothetical protein